MENRAIAIVENDERFKDLIKSIESKQRYPVKEKVIDMADDMYNFACRYNGKITAIKYYTNYQGYLIICKDGKNLSCDFDLQRKGVSDYDFDHCCFIDRLDEDQSVEYYFAMSYGTEEYKEECTIRDITHSIGSSNSIYIGNDAFIIIGDTLLYAEGYEDQLDEDVRALFIDPLVCSD